MKCAMLMVVLLTGCEGFVPNGSVKPVPKPVPTPNANEVVHRIELVIKQEGESRVVVSGDGTISVKSANASATAECQCGCGLIGCNCTTSRPGNGDLLRENAGENKSSAERPIGDIGAGKAVNKPVNKKREIVVLSIDGCDACDVAVKDMTALGFRVTKRMTDEAGMFPQIENSNGKRYQPPLEPYVASDRKTYMGRFWRTGRDDKAAAKILAE